MKKRAQCLGMQAKVVSGSKKGKVGKVIRVHEDDPELVTVAFDNHADVFHLSELKDAHIQD